MQFVKLKAFHCNFYISESNLPGTTRCDKHSSWAKSLSEVTDLKTKVETFQLMTEVLSVGQAKYFQN